MLAALVVALVLVLASPAVATNEDTVRVNEIDPAEGFVELLDLAPPGEQFFFGEAYAVRSYDGAGNDVAAQEYTSPLPFTPRSPFVMSIALPAGGGQVCFERQRTPEARCRSRSTGCIAWATARSQSRPCGVCSSDRGGSRCR